MNRNGSHWFYPRGTLARPGWESVVDASIPGWKHTSLGVAHLDSLDKLDLVDTGVERLIIPLSGSFRVSHTTQGREQTSCLRGRKSVFDGPTDVLYLGTSTSAVVEGAGRIAVAGSPTDDVKPTRLIAAEETPVELRGAGACSREIHNFGTPDALDAARFIVCEVITPAGNWSSYPPHKHDEHIPGKESRLEEIYYFEVAPAPSLDAKGGTAFGMFNAHSSAAGEIDIKAMVHTGDIALVPFGYHGPAGAAPGCDLYYLNVMAGPDAERVWRISDDPAYAWTRGAWSGEAVDPRLPYAARRSDKS